MTSMKDCSQVEATGDADAVTSELYVENPASYTVEDNHVSLVSENVEKCIELETDMLDDCMWESSNMESPLEYQDFTDNIDLHPGNINDIIFHCNICGKSFVYNYLLKNHMAEHKRLVHYKTNKCKFCGKQFKLKFGLVRHIQKHHNSTCATIVSTDPHTNIPNNEIISYPGQTEIISNTLERNSSDQIEHQLKFGLDRHIQKHRNSTCATIVSTAPHTNIPNNEIISYPGQTEIISNTLERNSSDQLKYLLVRKDLFPEPVPLDSNIITMNQEPIFQNIVQNYFQQKINIQQSNILRHNAISTLRETNSSDQEDLVNSNVSTLANEHHDLMAEQIPINTTNNNIVSIIIRDTPYFCIRKLPNINNEFCNDDYDQASLNNLIFTCRICKNPPSTDIHSFALHISNHRRFNMHECKVCDKTFNSVVLWTAHMTYHQQQINLNVSTVQFNLLESESNTFDTNIENIKLDESNVIQNSISIEDNNTDSATMSRNQKNETKSSSIKKMNYCNLCNRKFTKRCYFTNHMMMKHNINTNTPKQPTLIDCNESSILSENIDLTNECVNELSVPVINKNYNLSNHVNKSNEKKSTFCIICNKHFAHLGALTNHKRVHKQWFPCDMCEKKFSTPFQLITHRNKSHFDIVPYVCKICNKSYLIKHQWNYHLKFHYKQNNSYLEIEQHNYNLKSNISKQNIESISREDKIKCRYCKKECKTISQWKNHMSMSKECHRHGKPYLPEFTSNKTVLDKTYSNTHDNTGSQKEEQRTKHKQLFNHYEGTNSTYKKTSGQIISVNEKNTMKYICKICKMNFADNITLQKHTKIHASNMFKCKDCGQQYQTKLDLSNHIWENHSDN